MELYLKKSNSCHSKSSDGSHDSVKAQVITLALEPFKVTSFPYLFHLISHFLFISATMTLWFFFKSGNYAPTSRPLHLLFSLSLTFFPKISG